MDATDLKPGWQTTEFWTPIITLVVTALVTLHYVPAADAGTVAGYISALVVGLAGTIGNVLVVLHYIRSRTTAKEMILTANLEQRRLESLTAARYDGPCKVGPELAAPQGMDPKQPPK